MSIEFGRATTRAEIEAVQALRYAVYVDEMDRYHDVEGTEAHRFAEMIAEDATVAAKLLFNLSKMLCVRLIRAS